jgi:hypothetical protein
VGDEDADEDTGVRPSAQINQQFNMGPTADQDDEDLMRVINDAGDIAAKTIGAVIEAGQGEDSG